MPHYQVEYTVNHNIHDIYNMISDIERYPEFLPWCTGARIVEKEGNVIIADLVISFKLFTEHYRSRVVLEPPKNKHAQINASLVSGPLKHLENQWIITEVNEDATLVKFMVDFKFKSALLDNMIGVLFSAACQKMTAAFEDRITKLYGTGKNGSKSSKRDRHRTKGT